MRHSPILNRIEALTLDYNSVRLKIYALVREGGCSLKVIQELEEELDDIARAIERLLAYPKKS